MLEEARARAVDVPIKAIFTNRVIFLSSSSLGFFLRVPCYISLVSTVDMVISPASIVDMTAAKTAAIIRAQTRGGAGIVTLGEAGVHSLTDHAHPTMPHLDDEMLLPSLIQTVDIVHKWGAAASIELVHSGSRAKSEFLAPGGYVIGPSAMDANLYGDRVIEMDEAMMEEIADAYAQAAYMVEFAGVDIVNIHGGHGWLISQFLSDLNNKRKDKYGGSLENKARFPLMIIDRIRKRCPKLIIEFRLSSVEETAGGMEIEEVVEFAKLLDGKVDIIHVSAATFHDTKSSVRMFPSVFYPRGVNIDNAAKIKAVVKKSLVSVVGGLSDPQQMEEFIRDKKADIAVVGRQFIADPDWPKKAKAGRSDEIRTCTRCPVCISAGFIPHVPFSSGVLRCTANPRFGREYENTRREEGIERVKKVLIAGGGPAGLKAALTAASRGHRVILCEKEDHFNANLDYAKHVNFKEDLVNFAKSLVVSAQRCENLELRLNTPVTKEVIEDIKPDVLIIACGAEPMIPPIAGTELDHVYTVTDTIRKPLNLGKKVLVIGGALPVARKA